MVFACKLDHCLVIADRRNNITKGRAQRLRQITRKFRRHHSHYKFATVRVVLDDASQRLPTGFDAFQPIMQ